MRWQGQTKGFLGLNTARGPDAPPAWTTGPGKQSGCLLPCEASSLASLWLLFPRPGCQLLHPCVFTGFVKLSSVVPLVFLCPREVLDVPSLGVLSSGHQGFPPPPNLGDPTVPAAPLHRSRSGLSPLPRWCVRTCSGLCSCQVSHFIWFVSFLFPQFLPGCAPVRFPRCGSGLQSSWAFHAGCFPMCLITCCLDVASEMSCERRLRPEKTSLQAGVRGQQPGGRSLGCQSPVAGPGTRCGLVGTGAS